MTTELKCVYNTIKADGSQGECGEVAFAFYGDYPRCFFHLMQQVQQGARPVRVTPLPTMVSTASLEAFMAGQAD